MLIFDVHTLYYNGVQVGEHTSPEACSSKTTHPSVPEAIPETPDRTVRPCAGVQGARGDQLPQMCACC